MLFYAMLCYFILCVMQSFRDQINDSVCEAEVCGELNWNWNKMNVVKMNVGINRTLWMDIVA